jgi:hypothetical protein
MIQPANGRLTDVERTVRDKYAFVYWNANDEEDLWLVFDQESEARTAYNMMSHVLGTASAIIPV